MPREKFKTVGDGTLDAFIDEFEKVIGMSDNTDSDNADVEKMAALLVGGLESLVDFTNLRLSQRGLHPVRYAQLLKIANDNSNSAECKTIERLKQILKLSIFAMKKGLAKELLRSRNDKKMNANVMMWIFTYSKRLAGDFSQQNEASNTEDEEKKFRESEVEREFAKITELNSKNDFLQKEATNGVE